jgi:citrate lyase subunit beta/citryl-CoA lyase
MSSSSTKKASAGNKGDAVRSDCYVTLTLKEKGGLQIELTSKVAAMYGGSIRKQAEKILAQYKIDHALLTIEDSGALPFVIDARIEAAVRKIVKSDKEFLPEIIPENKNETPRDMIRFSRLYLPGNTPKLMINAGIHKPHGLILDLEDAVAPDRKYEARFVVRNALRQLNFYGAERMVRINQVPTGLEDLEYIVPHNVNLILVPKCEGKEQLEQVSQRIREILESHRLKRKVWLMPIIESALGVIKAHEIATASDDVVALAIGLEDYTADIGARRTFEGKESFFARSMVVNAAKAARIQAIDSVFSDVSDMEALKENVITSKALGFEGMGCIHPRQIEVIHRYFTPDEAEIERAKKIVNAFYLAEEKGLGVVSLGSKMIDAPVVKRAQKIVTLAISLGLLKKTWRADLSQ